MKKKRIKYLIAFLSTFLLFLLTPHEVLGAESAEMDGQVGIRFENDYTPTSSSGPEEIPEGKTPEKVPPATIKPVGGQSGKLLNTGELVTAGLSLTGLFLIGAVLALFYYKRRKEQHQNK